MCGIFGYIGKRDNAAELVLKGLKTLEYRGYDSWGIAVVTGKKEIVVKKRIGKIGEATVDTMPSSSLGFGHTRWATHGGVTEKNAHPHLDCSHSIALIHNGIIENYEALKKGLTKKHTFVSETDSEIASHMIEESTHPFVESVRKTFLQFEGSNAVIAINSKERTIVAIRNGSPLVVGYGEKEFFVASDASAIIPYTKRVYFMEDNDMAVVSDNGITISDCRTKKVKRVNPQTISWDAGQISKGTYKNFMLKEMYEQPEVIRRIKNQDVSDKKNPVSELALAIKKSYGTYFIGCGTASYSCIAGSYLFSKIAKRHVNVAIASEFGYQEDFLSPRSLVVALSQSGETMDLIDAVKKAKQKGATIASLVNVVGSTLFRMSDIPVPMHAGPEIGVASTKDMIAKLSHLILLSYGLGGRWEEGKTVLTRCASASDEVLEEKNVMKIRDLAKKIKSVGHIFVVGRGLSYPAALETALKIKEISYIHAEGLAAGELKHGPLALVEKGVPCIVFVPNDETYGANLAAAMEMRARGGYIIGVSNKNHEVFDAFLPVSNCGPATIIPNIITGQLLAYELTEARGLDADKPRNLAKSVTVK